MIWTLRHCFSSNFQIFDDLSIVDIIWKIMYFHLQRKCCNVLKMCFLLFFEKDAHFKEPRSIDLYYCMLVSS